MTLRIARHTNNLEKIKSFYVDILGFELLGSFENHSNYDGVFIGKSNSDWHFEFTTSPEKANHYSDEDDIVVLYPTEIQEHDDLVRNLSNHNIIAIASKNPYWNKNGKMFQDPDGYRIVISPLKINSEK